MKRATLFACAAACLFVATVNADSGRPDDHAPIGVMADHTHQAGEWMFSWRYMHMSMHDNRSGTDELSPTQITTTVPNRFFGLPMQPPTLRVVPIDMTMDMHMFGVMYAPTDWVTLMGMVNHVTREMEHITFAGPAGTTQLGRFTTRASGIGDSSVSALLSLLHTSERRLHATLGLGLPTADIRKRDSVLAPTGATPTLRLPYPMQLGAGTFDAIAGLTYRQRHGRVTWGAQWRSQWRLNRNDEHYALGDLHNFSLWSSLLAAPRVSVSARLAFTSRGNVDGIDALIRAPVQTADPHNYALQRIDAHVGVNWLLPTHRSRHRIGSEITLPVYQDLDGPQLESRWQITAGYQFAL